MIESLLARGRPDAQIGTEELWAGIRVLDLYAGSGALGIEALSRGATAATFVDSHADAIATIHANLNAAQLKDQAHVRAGDARRPPQGPYDLTLLDPPYDDDSALKSAESATTTLAPDAILVLEHPRRLASPEKLGNLVRQRDRRYGETVLSIYARGRYDRASAEGVG